MTQPTAKLFEEITKGKSLDETLKVFDLVTAVRNEEREKAEENRKDLLLKLIPETKLS